MSTRAYPCVPVSTREYAADSYQRQYRDVVLETLKAMPSRMQLDAYVNVS